MINRIGLPQSKNELWFCGHRLDGPCSGPPPNNHRSHPAKRFLNRANAGSHYRSELGVWGATEQKSSVGLRKAEIAQKDAFSTRAGVMRNRLTQRRTPPQFLLRLLRLRDVLLYGIEHVLGICVSDDCGQWTLAPSVKGYRPVRSKRRKHSRIVGLTVSTVRKCLGKSGSANSGLPAAAPKPSRTTGWHKSHVRLIAIAGFSMYHVLPGTAPKASPRPMLSKSGSASKVMGEPPDRALTRIRCVDAAAGINFVPAENADTFPFT